MKAKEIKQLRNELGWSQSQMGRHLGYSANAILKWERGMSEPPDVVKGLLVQLRQRLDQKKEKEKQEFIDKLAGIAVTGGIVAFIAFLFKNSNQD